MVTGAAVKKQMDGELNLQDEQMIVMNAADMLIDIYTAEALLLRVSELKKAGYEKLETTESVLRVFLHDATFRMRRNATDAVTVFSSGDLLKTFSMGIKRFTGYPPQNVSLLRKSIADLVISEDKYPFRMV